jgi:hypothetical protein
LSFIETGRAQPNRDMLPRLCEQLDVPRRERARFSWAAGGTKEAPLYIAGTDFVMLAADGRIEGVAGSTDAAPAPIK